MLRHSSWYLSGRVASLLESALGDLVKVCKLQYVCKVHQWAGTTLGTSHHQVISGAAQHFEYSLMT